MYSEQRALRVKRIVDRKRMYVLPLFFHLSLSPPLPPSPSLPLLPFLSRMFIHLFTFLFSLSLSFRLQPEERKKLLSLKETPCLKDNRSSSKERSPSTTPPIHIEDCTDGDRGNEDKQTEREKSSPTTTSDPVLPRPDRVEATVRGSDSTSSFGVLANSDGGEGGEGGGGLDSGLTEEERETVSFTCVNTVIHSR